MDQIQTNEYKIDLMGSFIATVCKFARLFNRDNHQVTLVAAHAWIHLVLSQMTHVFHPTSEITTIVND